MKQIKPAGKFMHERVGNRWHHIKHGEAQLTAQRLQLVKLYTEGSIKELLAEHKALQERIAELEARTINVKMPAHFYHVTAAENITVVRLKQVIDSLREACAVAGVNMNLGAVKGNAGEGENE
ncbi:hypothetical protein [Kosakonia sacchari]|uniref:hypothetical protein n=1 Tax=Kosakonia sacchari TaxID=1158459 RepID=UPI0015854976|nr:hypothetical protein [Kosakonia sacchari]NUL35093.1 hypothetical protein [Kosakonia sacchari]